MYRDEPMQCPECGTALAALDGRDKWRCKQCVGVLVGIHQIEIELGADSRHTIFTRAQKVRAGTRPCPACRRPMEPIQLIGMEIERCVEDGYAWFDRGELGRASRELEHELDRAATAFLASLVRRAAG